MQPFKITDILFTTFARDNRTVHARHIPTGLETKSYRYRAQIRNRIACIQEIEAKLVVVGFFENIIKNEK